MLLSRLLMRLAYWLSPQTVETYLPAIQLMNLSDPTQLHKLSSVLASLLNTAQSSTESTEPSPTQVPLEVEREIAYLHLDAARKQHRANCVYWQSKNLPHRVYGVDLYHDGASWVATAGNEGGDALLVGRGDSPVAALDDFDAQWLGVK
jgi:hypothetical protein